jgi:hypothetical protein
MTDLIERELELPASPVEVWQALTDPAWLQDWLADKVELELWPGGDARFEIAGQCAQAGSRRSRHRPPAAAPGAWRSGGPGTTSPPHAWNSRSAKPRPAPDCASSRPARCTSWN